MNRRSRAIYSLLAVTLVAGCMPLEQHTARFEKKWPATSVTHLDVKEIDGTISVDGNSPGEITMVAVVHARGVRPDSQKEYQGYFRTELDGSTLTIRTPHEHGVHFGWGRSVRVDYELRVPPTVALQLRTVNGRIETRAISGQTAASTVNGEVDLEATGLNEVAARTVNGRVQARFLDDFHGAKLGTVNGRVVAILPESASFLGDFTQVNGDFEAAFPLNIHSHPGSRRVSGDVNGGRYALKITTVNGDIKIDNGAPPAPPAPPALPPPPAKPPRT
jgi:putative adhesin